VSLTFKRLFWYHCKDPDIILVPQPSDDPWVMVLYFQNLSSLFRQKWSVELATLEEAHYVLHSDILNGTILCGAFGPLWTCFILGILIVCSVFADQVDLATKFNVSIHAMSRAAISTIIWNTLSVMWAKRPVYLAILDHESYDHLPTVKTYDVLPGEGGSYSARNIRKWNLR